MQIKYISILIWDTYLTVLFKIKIKISENFGKASAILKGVKCVGRFVGKPSPIMGNFYIELRKRVGEMLSTLPKHPVRAKILFFIDVISLLLLLIAGIVLSIWYSGSTHYIIIFLVSFLAHEIHGRLAGQAHAVLHMQVFDKSTIGIIEKIMILFGCCNLPGTLLPSPAIHYRKLVNSDILTSMREFGINHRGPWQHQVYLI